MQQYNFKKIPSESKQWHGSKIDTERNYKTSVSAPIERIEKFWRGLTLQEWSLANDSLCSGFLSGKHILVLPEVFTTIQTDFGQFILIQPACSLSEEPGPRIRETFWQGALKILLPKEAKSGDKIRVKKKAASGKSYIAEIVK